MSYKEITREKSEPYIIVVDYYEEKTSVAVGRFSKVPGEDNEVLVFDNPFDALIFVNEKKKEAKRTLHIQVTASFSNYFNELKNKLQNE